MAIVVDIADALVTEMNTSGLLVDAVAVRAYLPRYELKEMDTLHVTVVPRAIESSPEDRQRHRHEAEIDVAVQQRLPAQDEVAVTDALVELTQQVSDYLRRRRLTAFPAAVWVGTRHEPIYAVDHLDQLRQFTSVLTLTYRVVQ